MKILVASLVVVLLEAAVGENAGVCNQNCAASNSTEGNGTRILSRTKRFLIFPDGSSLQLVFCVQTSAIIPIGDIFLYGNTAALAWTLPSESKDILMLKDEFAQRRSDMKVNYVNENGKVIASVPYKRPNIVNPAFAKRSVDNMTYKEMLKSKMDRGKMHERQFQRFLKKDLDHSSLDFHRRSRVELYSKIESLITALGGDGRQCVLYKLCESRRTTTQGTFLQELLRVIFTLPKGKEFASETHKVYDEAHAHTDDCAVMYPGCENLEIR